MRGISFGFHELAANFGRICWEVSPENPCTVVLDPMEGGVGPVAGLWRGWSLEAGGQNEAEAENGAWQGMLS